MYKEDRLPQNAKEGLVYMLLVSIISVNTIAPIIIGMEQGFSKENYLKTVEILPIMWLIVIFLVKFVAGPLVWKLMPRFAKHTDSFNARTLFSIFFNVTILSIILTIVGTWVGMREVSFEPILNFFHVWPRNFGIAFWIEILIAQPIARFAMKKIHARKAEQLASE